MATMMSKKEFFSELPYEVFLQILHFIPEEATFYKLRTVCHYFNNTISNENCLLNTDLIQTELEFPIKTVADKNALWCSQQNEIDFLLSHKEKILNDLTQHFLLDKDFVELKSLSTEMISTYLLYKRHKALNHINQQIIFARINPQLQKLDCKNACLTRCPIRIFTHPDLQDYWQKLQHLNFSGNQLTSLPIDSLSFPKLTWLNVANNKLQHLWTFDGLTSLKWLYLENNQLTALPQSLTKLSTLISLDIHHNQIVVLPEKFHELQELVEFNVQYNCLSTLPVNFGSSTSFMPDLRHNALTQLPDTLQEKRLINSETNEPISKANLLSTQAIPTTKIASLSR